MVSFNLSLVLLCLPSFIASLTVPNTQVISDASIHNQKDSGFVKGNLTLMRRFWYKNNYVSDEQIKEIKLEIEYAQSKLDELDGDKLKVQVYEEAEEEALKTLYDAHDKKKSEEEINDLRKKWKEAKKTAKEVKLEYDQKYWNNRYILESRESMLRDVELLMRDRKYANKNEVETRKTDTQ